MEREDSIFDEHAMAGKDALAEINFEVVDTGRWLLKVIGGPNNGAEFAMQAGNSYVIGTDPNTCDIVYHDTSVSRQHARITVDNNDTLYIEDLQSRNGTLIDGEALKGRRQLAPNVLVTMGTTSFIVYDREGEMHTIISPLLPSIVKVLQKDDSRKTGGNESASTSASKKKNSKSTIAALQKEKKPSSLGGIIAIAIISALVVVGGIGVSTLFKGQPVAVEEPQDYTKTIADIMAPFPSIKYSYNKSTGRLLLVGHVLNAVDKSQLLYNLQGLKFIKSFDDSGIIIDEYVWQEINQLLSNNPNWKGITVQAPSPGQFVVTGYLQSRKQAEQLSQFLSENFRYLDLLKRKIVVDEDVITQVTNTLQGLGVKNLAVQMINGELTISGGIPSTKVANFAQVLKTFRAIGGVRLLKNFIVELPPEATMINISDKYTVTGYSNYGNALTVVINGKILSPGDMLDGMTITSIKQNSVLLEKDGVKYRIDYSRY